MLVNNGKQSMLKTHPKTNTVENSQCQRIPADAGLEGNAPADQEAKH